MNLQASEGPEHTKAVMCRTHDLKYVRRLYEQDELYDLQEDPNEFVNLWDRDVQLRRELQGALLDALVRNQSWDPPKTCHA